MEKEDLMVEIIFQLGKMSFIGLGTSTNEEALNQLLENDVFGVNRVVAVKDSWKNQEQMHLDTYFNVINPNLAVLVDMRMSIDGEEPELKIIVDVYYKVNGKYEKVSSNLAFQS